MALAVNGYAPGSQLYNCYVASSSSLSYSSKPSTDFQENKSAKVMSAKEILNAPSTAYLVTRLPTVASLSVQLSVVQDPTYDPAGQVAWCHEVLGLVERKQRLQASSSSLNPGKPPSGTPARITDPELQRLIDVAIPMLQKLAGRKKAMQSFVPGYVAEATYLCSTCEASGAFPQHIAHNPKRAFSQCEQAAKAGYHPAWLDLARDFEKFGDAVHARDCYEHGAAHAVPGCIFRLGMAYLSGQLGLLCSPEHALPLLKQAAALSTPDTPHPVYFYALLLLNELPELSVQPYLLLQHISPGSALAHEARRHLERAAYLGHAPAQARLGQAYEFADDAGGFPFDAALSVQYYGLAAAQGDADAEMALSKWFLCGCEGVFECDETLALSYAESAASRGLPDAMFAMGYYAEVGVGCAKDLVAAQKWYQMAAQQGNTDAPDRLRELSRSKTLSRKEHEQLTETTLVRKRTQARIRSEATPRNAAPLVRSGSAADPASGTHPMPVPTTSGPPHTTDLPPQGVYPQGYPQAEVRPLAPRGRSPPQQQPSFPVRNSPPRGREASLAAGAPQSRGPSPAPSRGYPTLPGAGSRDVSPALAHAPGANSQAHHHRAQSASVSPNPNPQMNGQYPAQGRSSSGSREPSNSLPVPQSRSRSSRTRSPGASSPPMHRGPQTFQEMGIHTAKVEEKECVVM
ncbi:HCP-like protein [Daedalea quercina L-15889]|uniref:HCP-like protein n=1 Tax=Daedalea quercina L-15889 TaxID=1314783 RepID=A0A165L982_9APHY|nr:HCP-like protein [Daedalea quercina L-15889]